MSDDRAVERGSTPSRSPDRPGESTPSTALNALIGGVVTVGTALFVPFSPALGGGVAGFLEGGDTDAGLKVGTLAGLLATIPLLVVVLVAVAVVPSVLPIRGGVGLGVVALLAVLLVCAYTVGLSALGGVLGTYLQREL